MRRKTLSSIFALCLSLLTSCDSKGPEDRPDLLPPKILCVLCPGIGIAKSKTEDLRKRVEQTIKRSGIGQLFISIMTSTLTKKESYEESIPMQSKRLVGRIEEKVASMMSSKTAKQPPIMLIGTSQGGLRAFLAATELVKKGYEVKCLVTIVSPWKGVGLLTDTIEAKRLVLELGDIDKNMIELLDKSYQQGISGMIPGSALLEDIRKKLGKNPIPILAIGSTFDLNDYRGAKADTKKSFNELAGGSAHDGLISIESQLAEGIDKKHFECKTLENAHHGHLSKKRTHRRDPSKHEDFKKIFEGFVLRHAGELLLVE